MVYAAVFIAGLLVGLLLNWRSWKALDVFIQVSRLDAQTHRAMKSTNDQLWKLLDADKFRH